MNMKCIYTGNHVFIYFTAYVIVGCTRCECVPRPLSDRLGKDMSEMYLRIWKSLKTHAEKQFTCRCSAFKSWYKLSSNKWEGIDGLLAYYLVLTWKLEVCFAVELNICYWKCMLYTLVAKSFVRSTVYTHINLPPFVNGHQLTFIWFKPTSLLSHLWENSAVSIRPGR